MLLVAYNCYSSTCYAFSKLFISGFSLLAYMSLSDGAYDASQFAVKEKEDKGKLPLVQTLYGAKTFG